MENARDRDPVRQDPVNPILENMVQTQALVVVAGMGVRGNDGVPGDDVPTRHCVEQETRGAEVVSFPVGRDEPVGDEEVGEKDVAEGESMDGSEKVRGRGRVEEDGKGEGVGLEVGREGGEESEGVGMGRSLCIVGEEHGVVGEEVWLGDSVEYVAGVEEAAGAGVEGDELGGEEVGGGNGVVEEAGMGSSEEAVVGGALVEEMGVGGWVEGIVGEGGDGFGEGEWSDLHPLILWKQTLCNKD